MFTSQGGISSSKQVRFFLSSSDLILKYFILSKCVSTGLGSCHFPMDVNISVLSPGQEREIIYNIPWNPSSSADGDADIVRTGLYTLGFTWNNAGVFH